MINSSKTLEHRVLPPPISLKWTAFKLEDEGNVTAHTHKDAHTHTLSVSQSALVWFMVHYFKGYSLTLFRLIF